MKKVNLKTAVVAVALTLISVIGYSQNKVTTTSNEDVKLYVLDGGSLDVNNLEIFDTTDVYHDLKYPNAPTPIWIIKHPKGILVWDAGLPEGLINAPDGYTTPDGNFTLKVKRTLTEQLKEINIKPEEVTYISFSHMHSDHTGNANMFTNATWIVQNNEYELAKSPDAAKYSFAPESYSKLLEGKVRKLEGDLDVFGDGSVKIMSTPGHTIGHQSLLLKLSKTGTLYITGDLYHFKANRTFGRVPSFNYDKKQTLESIKKFEALVKKTKARVIIHHDLKDYNSLPHSPIAIE
jgi:N-acyl homoserine lactone hydrolase